MAPRNLDKALNELKRSEGDIVTLVSKLIQFRSENPPLEDCDVQFFIRDFLKEAGLHVVLHDPGNRAWALTSVFGQKSGGGFIFYGHADVVPAGDPTKWRYPPFSGVVVDGRIHGRGSSDMKAGLAAELFVYRLLYQCEVDLNGPLEFVCVLDEENWQPTPAGWSTSHWLLATGRLRGKACVMGEQTGVHKICVGERGDYWVSLRVTSAPRHGSAPIYDENPCVKLFRLVEDIRQRTAAMRAAPPEEIRRVIQDSPRHIVDDLGEAASGLSQAQILDMLLAPTLNLGVIRGGTMVNIVPDGCEAQIAFCVPIGMSRKALHDLVTSVVGGTAGVTMELLGEPLPDDENDSQSGPSYTSPNTGIAQTLRATAAQVIGVAPDFYVTLATSDANVFRAHGVQTCLYGPGRFPTTHGYNEWVSVDAVKTMAQIYLRAAANYLA